MTLKTAFIAWQAGSTKDLPAITDALLRVPVTSRVYLLEGEMGSGKTTLTGSLIRALGSTDQVQSPTYGLVHEYQSPGGIIYHFDFYRIKNDEEAMDIGLEEYLDSGAYCFIEWPEKIARLIPQGANRIRIQEQAAKVRRIELTTG